MRAFLITLFAFLFGIDGGLASKDQKKRSQ
jgi:hypothetical protein